MKPFTFLVLCVACLVAAAGSFLSAKAPIRDAVQQELARFDGTWEFVSIEVEGNAVPNDELQKSGYLVIKDGKFTFKDGDVQAGTFKVLPKFKPKQVDVTFTEGPEKGKTYLGIYELEGDTYKV